MNITMEQIERARELVSKLIKKKQDGDRSETLLGQIAAFEVGIDTMIVEYHAQPNCPFCGKGKMIRTTTKGRLRCEFCQAVGLVGRIQ